MGAPVRRYDFLHCCSYDVCFQPGERTSFTNHVLITNSAAELFPTQTGLKQTTESPATHTLTSVPSSETPNTQNNETARVVGVTTEKKLTTQHSTIIKSTRGNTSMTPKSTSSFVTSTPRASILTTKSKIIIVHSSTGLTNPSATMTPTERFTAQIASSKPPTTQKQATATRTGSITSTSSQVVTGNQSTQKTTSLHSTTAAGQFYISKIRPYSNLYRKFHLQKPENFQTKKSNIFHISDRNIDCVYSLEPPLRGDSNEYPQYMFFSKNKKK